MSQSSDSQARLNALKGEFGMQLAQARERFDQGKFSLAADAAGKAAKIAGRLTSIESDLGNLCADFRLLEWEPKR